LSGSHPKNGTGKHRRCMTTPSKAKFYSQHDADMEVFQLAKKWEVNRKWNRPHLEKTPAANRRR